MRQKLLLFTLLLAFGFALTPYLKKGENIIAVRIDNDWDYREEDTRTKLKCQTELPNLFHIIGGVSTIQTCRMLLPTLQSEILMETANMKLC